MIQSIYDKNKKKQRILFGKIKNFRIHFLCQIYEMISLFSTFISSSNYSFFVKTNVLSEIINWKVSGPMGKEESQDSPFLLASSCPLRFHRSLEWPRRPNGHSQTSRSTCTIWQYDIKTLKNHVYRFNWRYVQNHSFHIHINLTDILQVILLISSPHHCSDILSNHSN